MSFPLRGSVVGLGESVMNVYLGPNYVDKGKHKRSHWTIMYTTSSTIPEIPWHDAATKLLSGIEKVRRTNQEKQTICTEEYVVVSCMLRIVMLHTF